MALSDPVGHAVAVTPSDSTDTGLFGASTALYVGVGGDVKLTTFHGDTVTFVSLAPGWHPIRVRRVWATGTTATNMIVVR